MVLSFGEMLPGESPAPEIWLDDEALNDHFQRLKEKRSEGASPDDDTSEWEENAAAVAVLRAIGER